MCTLGLAACWFHRPWVRLKLPRNQSRDQYFPRLHRVTRGAHTLGTSMLCLWGCGSRGCISLVRVMTLLGLPCSIGRAKPDVISCSGMVLSILIPIYSHHDINGPELLSTESVTFPKWPGLSVAEPLLLLP